MKMAILAAAAAVHGCRAEEMRASTRKAYVVAARRAAAILLRQRGYSLKQIGIALGGRHHTSVLRYLRTAHRLEQGVLELVEKIAAQIHRIKSSQPGNLQPEVLQ